MIFQFLAFIAQSGMVITDFVPLKYKALAIAVISGAQWLVSRVAHDSNRDGTDAEFAYEKR